MEMDIASSPLSSAPPSQPMNTDSSQRKNEYRNTRELSFELAHYVQNYLEEAMFTQAFRLLSQTISADVSDLSQQRPVSVPPTSYLALTSTLSVHPTLTTRTITREKREQAISALRLLRLLHKTVGPVGANFGEAFTFTKFARLSQRGDNDDEDEIKDKINSPYTETDSIWNRADDFWAVVGWIMNCACLSGMYAERWKSWSQWLEFMLDVLETDWRVRIVDGTCEKSILWQYITRAIGGDARARRILRAIFADGSTQSLNEFREVFRRELKEPSKDAGKIKKREGKIDVEQEIYGDYMAKDDSDVSSEDETATQITGKRPTRNLSTRRITPKTSDQSLRSSLENSNDQDASIPTPATLGPPKSLTFRLRLIQLLSNVSDHPTLTRNSPEINFPALDHLNTLFVEFIKPLPFHIFQPLVSPVVQPLNTTTHVTLLEFLLQRTIEASAPSVRSEKLLTQQKLEEEYLPFAASRNTLDANAKVSVLLEVLMRKLNAEKMLEGTDSLSEAVERGIKRRFDRTGPSHARKGVKKMGEVDEEQVLWSWLNESGIRMRLIVKGLKG